MAEKWYWVELIGFDNESPDHGVGNYLDRLAEPPAGVSLLLSNIDFVNLHEDREDTFLLRPCDCSYGAHKASYERKRQAWTNRQLMGLVRSLHERGVKVLFAFFNLFTCAADDDGMYAGEYCTAHPELWDLDACGRPAYSVNVLKRLRGGGYYEDYLFEQVRRVIAYYGFDGVQLADGISSWRLTVENGDCSDDLFGQYLTATRDTPPEDILLGADGDEAAYRRRREWVLSARRAEWLRFLAGRWKTYYEKAARALSGYVLVCNSAWTRDPFEAYYRYGIDYTQLPVEKLSAIMVEETSATVPLYSAADRGGFALSGDSPLYAHYEFMLMQMRIKAALPRLTQYSLAPINDTYEQWDILRHAPMEMARAILRRRNCFIYDGTAFVKPSAAPFYCLADGIAKSDWQYIEKLEAVSAPPIRRAAGYTLLVSEQGPQPEAERYIATREYSATELSVELMREGLQIASCARVRDGVTLSTPLLALNPQFWSAEERKKLACCKAPVAVISTAPVELAGASFSVPGPYLHVATRRMPAETSADASAFACERIACSEEPYNEQGAIWTMPLRYHRVPRAYFARLAALLNGAAGLAESSEPGVKLTCYEQEDGLYRLLLSSDAYTYLLPEIRFPKRVAEVRCLTKYAGYEIPVSDGVRFTVRVPPRGMEVLLVRTEEEA